MIHQQDVSHLAFEVGIAAFHVVGDLVGLQGLGGQNPLHGGFRGQRQAGMSLIHGLPTDMLGQSLPAPDLGGVAQLLALGAGQMDDPSLGVFGEYGLAAVRVSLIPADTPIVRAFWIRFETLLRVIFTVFMMVAMLLPV